MVNLFVYIPSKIFRNNRPIKETMGGMQMSSFYQKFLRKRINLAALGVEQSSDNTAYFCTPKGAYIIGWAGVDGIHYCFIRGFGEMVFAVNPSNANPDYVHPLARSFEDFLQLLLSCGSADALEQAWMWDKEQFNAYIKENTPTESGQAVLAEIVDSLFLTPMVSPWQYIKELQNTFDYSKIKYTEDFYDPDMNGNVERTLPKWEVYFDGNFWGHSGKQRPGKEITVQTHFHLNNKEWYIPSIYSCSKGLVIDFCVKIPAQHIANFIDKWKLSPENDGSSFSEEQQEKIEAENPMAVNISSEIVLNGKMTSYSHGCGLSWNPCFPEQNGIESDGACKHYGLDQDSGWVIWRSAFPWQTKRKPSISSLSVTIKHNPINICGSHFNINVPGERIEFTNPITNILHTLTVQEYEQQEIPTNRFSDDYYDFPSHCIAMSYTISPDLDDESFSVRDCSIGDRPRKKRRNPMEPQAISDCCAVGIIGGAHSPAAIIFKDSGQGKLRAVCSSLHFEPVETVDWKIIFHEKPCQDMTVKLL